MEEKPMNFYEAKRLLDGLSVAYNNPKIADLKTMVADFEELVNAAVEVMKEFPSHEPSEYEKNYYGKKSLRDSIDDRIKNTRKLQALAEKLYPRTRIT